ncbi:MAG TPA: hypothetical protein VGB83_06955 [Actinomycetota bacterium]
MARRTVAGALALAAIAANAQPASAAPKRLAIGDSVMLGARDELKEDAGFRRVDADVSRQFYAADNRVRYWKRRGVLPRVVFIHLGNNGRVLAADCDDAVRAAGSWRSVFFATLKVPRSWRKPNNVQLRACAKRHANAYVIGWNRYSKDHPEWFASDGFHLSPLGQDRYAAFVDRRITRVV